MLKEILRDSCGILVKIKLICEWEIIILMTINLQLLISG